MGKGNQFIRNRDGDGVRTFYFDPYGDFEEEKKAMIQEKREDIAEELSGLPFAERRRKLEQIMLEGRFPIRIKDERVWDRISMSADDEIDNLGYEVAGKTSGIEGFTRRKKREFEDCLAAGYHDSGFVIAESKNCQVVIADNECNVAIACIPAFSRESIEEDFDQDDYCDEAQADLEKTRKRADANYEIDQSDINERASELRDEAVEKEIEKRLEAYKKDANAAMRKIHAFFGTNSISVRDGAWTSITLKQYDELTEEERNNYY